jgi:S-formylglutathione hydrolase FrmB
MASLLLDIRGTNRAAKLKIEKKIHFRSRRLRGSIILLCCVSILSCGRHEEPPAPDRPRFTSGVKMVDITFHSAALNRDMQYRAIAPAKIAANQKFPVLYLLHGGGGGFRDWSNFSDVAGYAERGLILVMPEGNNSYYINSADRSQDRYEDYIVHDLIAAVEGRFPAASGRTHRAIAGVSMGGFGAIVLALKHPDLFVFAGGLSSALDVPSRPFSIKRIGRYRQHSSIFGPWGSQSRRAGDPFVLVRSVDPVQTPYLFLTCGDSEGLMPTNRRFAAMLQARHFRYEFKAVPGGHDWNQWNRDVPALMKSVNEHLKPS